MKLERRRRMVVVSAVVMALLTISATSVFATDLFTDVPNSPASVHNAVEAIFNAGVTAGCGGPKYCPNNAVTRGQMAIFLDRVGALQLRAGGIPNTVVDALTVQGTLVGRLLPIPTFQGDPLGNSVCSNTLSLAPFNPTFGDYTLKVQLYDVTNESDFSDPEMNTALINVGVRDDSAAGYQVCFRRTDAGNLSRGAYRLYVTLTESLGQGLFGSSAGAAKARDAANNARSAENR